MRLLELLSLSNCNILKIQTNINQTSHNQKALDLENITINNIYTNSQDVKPNSLFLCTSGITADRHNYVDDAVKNGAIAIIASKKIESDALVIYVPDVNEISPILYREFYHNPQNKLKVIGVTGTDGKTSTATITQTLIGKSICGYFGTNGLNVGEASSSNFYQTSVNNTTPDSDKLFEYLDIFVKHNASFASLEISSEAIHYNRLSALKLDVLGHTNITSEHLNTHGTVENYANAKIQGFIKHLKINGYAVINLDDSWAKTIIEQISSYRKDVKILTYGKNKNADLNITKYQIFTTHTDIEYQYKNQNFRLTSPLLGDFNIENLSCSILTCLALGISLDSIKANLTKLNISGRLQMIQTNSDFNVMIDYAHTPNGITRLLEFTKTLPDIDKTTVIIGQAGERDATKRSTVGSIVAKNCTQAIFTYEDPRNESLDQIFNDITKDIKELKNWIIIKDRKEAIKHAINNAVDKELIMILGKGAEDYQKVGNKKIHFSDVEEAQNALKQYQKIN